MAENIICWPLADQILGCEGQDIRSYSPLTLAYIGDAVYEAVIRTKLVKSGNIPVNKLHHRATRLVKAQTQAALARILEPWLHEDEAAVYRRGRNAHSPTMAKHASMSDYRHATGFEALVGYLYLSGNEKRMLELIRDSLEVYTCETQKETGV